MMTRGRLLPTLIATLAVVGGACTSTTTSRPEPRSRGATIMSLVRAESCDQFGDWVKEQALEHVGPYGLEGSVGGIGFGDVAVAAREGGDAGVPLSTEASMDSAAPSPANAGLDESATGTNNQEADVDEADLVKTDGTRVVVANGNRLQVFSLVDGAPYLDAALDLGEVYASRLFLVGDTAYVLGDGGYYGPEPMPMPMPIEDGAATRASESSMMPSGSTVVQVDLSGDPVVVDRVTLEGSIVDGRMVDGTVRLVVRSAPIEQLGFVYPQSAGGERTAAATNRSIVEDSTATDWLPSMIGTDGSVEPMVSCSDLSYPQEFGGFGTVSVVTIADGLGSLNTTSVTADAQTVYASASTLYVAVSRWGGFDATEPEAHVDIHAFATEGSAPAVYTASGRVAGTLLNQYSLSERDGYLRVATTTTEPFDCPPNADCAAPPTDNGISVLARDGDSLEEVGRVDGLGRGEEIKSVRYMGDRAYVVTFRQTDPFYVVDLADPEAPRVLGELKVPGFSSYLHPVGDGLILGVGSDADDSGRVRGAKVSLYDTSDPLNPTELSNWTDPAWSFMVAGDPKAFTFDAASQRVFLPAYGSGFCDDAGRCSNVSNSVLVFSIAGRTVDVVGWVDHGTRTPSPQPRPEPPTDLTTTTVTTTTEPDPTSTVPTSSTTTTVVDAPITTIPGTSPGVARQAPPSEGDIAGPEELIAPEDPYYQYSPTITRAFVVEGRLVTVSETGIASHLVPALTLVGFASFG